MSDESDDTVRHRPPIRVALVDDHLVVRRGLRTFLESFPDIHVVGEAATGEQTLTQVESWLPDVVLMDLLMPGGMDGIETARHLRRLVPNTQVVVLTSDTGDARVGASLRAGVIGYVRKDAEPEVLLEAVRAAARGQSLLDPAVSAALARELGQNPPGRPYSALLTEREQEVVRLIALGRTNREIAEALVVSAETVKTHVGNILAKLQLSHRTQVVIYALKRGLISLDEVSDSTAER
jgi:two-component system, NarL family, response regulator LiaR